MIDTTRSTVIALTEGITAEAEAEVGLPVVVVMKPVLGVIAAAAVTEGNAVIATTIAGITITDVIALVMNVVALALFLLALALALVDASMVKVPVQQRKQQQR